MGEDEADPFTFCWELAPVPFPFPLLDWRPKPERLKILQLADLVSESKHGGSGYARHSVENVQS